MWDNLSDPGTLVTTIVALTSIGILLWIKLVKIGPVYKGEKQLDGKTVLITGGNSGIGKATAIELAKRKARVIIACRNMDRSNEAITDIKIESGNESIVSMNLDLSDFDDVRRFATEFSNTEPQLDILVNNAGVMLGGRTKDGLSLMLATNQLGQFLLTHLLLPLMKRTAESGLVRIVNVASSVYMAGRIDLDNLTPKNCTSTLAVARQYWNSKLMNIYFTSELNKRLCLDDPERKNITTYSVHPGFINSRFYLEEANKGLMAYVRPVVAFLITRSTYYGCQTTLYCCLEEGIENNSGEYFTNMKVTKLMKHARDPEMGEKLWKKCEELTGLA